MSQAAGSESQAHRELKRLTLLWAQSRGFRVAAMEVSLPDRGARIDVAACRLQRQGTAPVTAIFECKAFAGDFRRDARPLQAMLERLELLQERKARIEREMCLHFPSIRNGDSLFPEYETLDFERPGYERYQRVIEEAKRLSMRLHANTKFDRLVKYGEANLYYVVAEPDIFRPHELPAGWGVLARNGNELELVSKPIWHEVSESRRLHFLQRIALAGTRAVNREAGITFDELNDARRGF